MPQDSWLDRARKALWALFLVTLPVTSFPFFPGGLGGRTEVRPLALYPLLVLLLLVTLPYLFNKPIPRNVVPLMVFILLALGSTVFAYTQGIDPEINITITARSVRMLTTLAMGAAFYLTVAVAPQTDSDLRFTMRWIYAGLFAALIWGTVHISFILFYSPEFFAKIETLQGFISVRGLFESRISGMAYEPNWFAEQITFLYMPWLFSAVMSNITVFRWRWHRVTIEALLLVYASGVLVFTFSRTGYVLIGVQLILALLIWPRKRRPGSKKWIDFARRIAFVGAVVIVLLVVMIAVGSQNRYFSRLWLYFVDENAVGNYLHYIAFSQRMIYWETAYQLYEEFPLLGIGLGNYVFYFEEKLSDRPLYPTPELLYKFVPEEGKNQLVVPKNLFVRILAETGILGMAAYLAFLIGVIGSAVYLFLSPIPEVRYWGQAGILALVVFIGVAFSVDSFAMPNAWIVFGLLTASTHVYSRS
jgi:O-antigen ligase